MTRERLFQFRKMPFDLNCAETMLQKLIHKVVAGLQWDTYLILLDDSITIKNTFNDMIQTSITVFDKLLEYGFKLKSKNCT